MTFLPIPSTPGCSAHCFHPRCQQRVSGSPRHVPCVPQAAGFRERTQASQHDLVTPRREGQRGLGPSMPRRLDLKTGSDPCFLHCVPSPLRPRVLSHVCSSGSTSQSTQRTLTAGCPRGSDLQVTPSDVSAGSTGRPEWAEGRSMSPTCWAMDYSRTWGKFKTVTRGWGKRSE